MTEEVIQLATVHAQHGQEALRERLPVRVDVLRSAALELADRLLVGAAQRFQVGALEGLVLQTGQLVGVRRRSDGRRLELLALQQIA